MRQLFLYILLLNQTNLFAQYIKGFVGADSTLRDHIYVINVNTPGSLSSGSEFNLMDSVPLVDGRFELRNRPWMKEYNGLIRLQVVPKEKEPFYFSIKIDNQNYFMVNNRTAVEFSLPRPLRFSEISFTRIDADNQAVQAFIRKKMQWLNANRALRKSGAGMKSAYDSLASTTYQQLVTLFEQDQRDICRWLVAQELIGFKFIIAPEKYAATVPRDLMERFSPAFKKTRSYRWLLAYYESEMKKIPFSVFSKLVLQDTTLKSREVVLPRSKILVIDFWASWCKPCRHGNKTYLSEIARLYPAEDVSVVSISLDEKLEDWLRAFRQDRINWPCYLDSSGTGGRLALASGVVGLPRLLVYDSNRENVANDLSGELLLEFLRKTREPVTQ